MCATDSVHLKFFKDSKFEQFIVNIQVSKDLWKCQIFPVDKKKKKMMIRTSFNGSKLLLFHFGASIFVIKVSLHNLCAKVRSIGWQSSDNCGNLCDIDKILYAFAFALVCCLCVYLLPLPCQVQWQCQSHIL